MKLHGYNFLSVDILVFYEEISLKIMVTLLITDKNRRHIFDVTFDVIGSPAMEEQTESQL